MVDEKDEKEGERRRREGPRLACSGLLRRETIIGVWSLVKLSMIMITVQLPVRVYRWFAERRTKEVGQKDNGREKITFRVHPRRPVLNDNRSQFSNRKFQINLLPVSN